MCTAPLVERPISLADVWPYAPKRDFADLPLFNAGQVCSLFDAGPALRINYPID